MGGGSRVLQTCMPIAELPPNTGSLCLQALSLFWTKTKNPSLLLGASTLPGTLSSPCPWHIRHCLCPSGLQASQGGKCFNQGQSGGPPAGPEGSGVPEKNPAASLG